MSKPQNKASWPSQSKAQSIAHGFTAAVRTIVNENPDADHDQWVSLCLGDPRVTIHGHMALRRMIRQKLSQETARVMGRLLTLDAPGEFCTPEDFEEAAEVLLDHMENQYQQAKAHAENLRSIAQRMREVGARTFAELPS